MIATRHEQDTDLAQFDDTGTLVTICCTDKDNFVKYSDEDRWAGVERLRDITRRRHTKKELERAEQACGINHNIHGTLADSELRPIVPPSSCNRDTMHTLPSKGIFSLELHLINRTLN